MESEKLDSILTSISEKKEKQCNEDENFKKIMVSANIQEELPFTFNFSEFHPSKDALSTDLIAECVSFNKTVKQIRDKMKKAQYEW